VRATAALLFALLLVLVSALAHKGSPHDPIVPHVVSCAAC